MEVFPYHGQARHLFFLQLYPRLSLLPDAQLAHQGSFLLPSSCPSVKPKVRYVLLILSKTYPIPHKNMGNFSFACSRSLNCRQTRLNQSCYQILYMISQPNKISLHLNLCDRRYSCDWCFPSRVHLDWNHLFRNAVQ